MPRAKQTMDGNTPPPMRQHEVAALSMVTVDQSAAGQKHKQVKEVVLADESGWCTGAVHGSCAGVTTPFSCRLQDRSTAAALRPRLLLLWSPKMFRTG